MKKGIQRSIQVITLLLFAFLLIKGKVQIWMLIFAGSTALALLFSRFYCGWICPINTIIRPITWMKRKMKIRRKKMPAWIKSDVLRIIVLILFLATMVFVLRTGNKLPVLPALLGLGVLLSVFFDEALWHRHLCPYGTILSFVGRFSFKSMKIEEDACNNCRRCVRVCPSNAIVKGEKHQIVKAECLVCHECERVCNEGAIAYR